MSELQIANHRKTLFLIDGPSLNISCKDLGFRMDFRKLHEWAQRECPGSRVVYYTVVDSNPSNVCSILPVVTWLETHGYGCKRKPMPASMDPDALANGSIRGGVIVEVAIDLFKAAQHMDEVVLFSGDGDLAYAIKQAQEEGLRVTAISHVSGESPSEIPLRRAADNFIDIASIAHMVARENAYA